MTTVNKGLLERLRKLVEGLEVEEDQVVTDLIVIAKTSSMKDSRVGVCYNFDTGDWVVRRGMLDAAVDIETEAPPRRDEEED